MGRCFECLVYGVGIECIHLFIYSISSINKPFSTSDPHVSPWSIRYLSIVIYLHRPRRKQKMKKEKKKSMIQSSRSAAT